MTTHWQEALARLEGNDLLQLGMDANAAREQLWPERVVTYTVGYALTIGASPVEAAAQSAIARGARGFLLSAAPDSTLSAVVSTMRKLGAHFSEVRLTGFSADEIQRLAAGGSVEDTLHSLREAGLCASSLAGSAGRPDQGTMEPPAWNMHRAAHVAGLSTVAVLPLRREDTPAQWIALLEQVAALQQETRGFLACEPRIEHLDRTLDEVTGARYLQFLALARIYLNGIPHIQADWSIFGPKVLQLALRFGADDAGLVLATPRDPHTPSHHSGEEELRRIIRDAGFTPVERDAVYARSFVY